MRINEFIGNKCIYSLVPKRVLERRVAMKLLFSRINEERKCTISLQQGVYVSLESERGFISSQILLIGDRNEICGQIFSGFRTEHTCSVHLVDFV